MVGVSVFQHRFRALPFVAVCLVLGAGLTTSSVASAEETTGTVGGVHGPGKVSVVSTGETTGGDDPTDPTDPTDPEDPPGGTDRFEGITEFPWTCQFGLGTSLDDSAVRTTTSPRDGNYYHLICEPNPGFTGIVDRIDNPVYQYNAADPFPDQPGLVTSIQVRDQAEDLAVPTTLTPGLSPDGRQITGVETWFWPEGSTETVVATASAGGLTVTVEARYLETTFTLPAPNNESFTCTDFVEWTPGAVDSPCTHAFTEETADQRIVAESTWEFYWFDNLLAQEPALYATVTNTEVATVPVIDLEAVISRN